jgi:DNA-binding MarR family transcriptional regulator
MEVTDSAWVIIRELHRAAQIQRRAALRAPLDPVTLGVLNLAAQAPVRPSTAAAELDVPAQSITRAVTELVNAGFAHRSGSRADGRSYVIELTEEGRAQRSRFREELTTRFARHLDGWTDTEVATFASQLTRLVSSLAADVPAAPAAPAAPNSWRRQ